MNKNVRNTCIYKQANSYQVTSDLLNRGNVKVAIAQICNVLQVCNLTMLQLTQKFLKFSGVLCCFQHCTIHIKMDNFCGQRKPVHTVQGSAV